MNYQFQVDYGAGYEEVFPIDDSTSNPEHMFASWLATVEAEGGAQRARVLSGGKVVAENVFNCSLVENRIHPDGGTQHLLRCVGGEIVVNQQPDGRLSASARSGYLGDAERAQARAIEAVKGLQNKM